MLKIKRIIRRCLRLSPDESPEPRTTDPLTDTAAVESVWSNVTYVNTKDTGSINISTAGSSLEPAQVQIRNAWAEAVANIEGKCTTSQQEILSRCNTPEELLAHVTELSSRQLLRSPNRLLARTRPLVDSVRQYDEVMRTFCGCGLGELAILWGSLTLMITIVEQYLALFDKVLDVLFELSETLPRMNQYTSMFANQERVQWALSLVYRDLLDFCTLSLTFLSKRGITRLWKLSWKDFEIRSRAIVTNINRHKALADVEAVASRMGEQSLWRMEDIRNFQAIRTRELIAWLSPAECEYRWEVFQNARIPGTGLWFLNHKEVENWKLRQTSVLWLHGIPGCGKTLLSSSLIDNLRKSALQPTETSPGSIVVFFFCDTTIAANRMSISVLRSVIAQLITQIPTFVDFASQVMLRSGQERASSFEGLFSILREILSNYTEQNISMVLDAWDECEDGRETLLLTELLKHARSSTSNFQLFISSRNEPEFREQLSGEHQIRLVPSLVEEDLKRYVVTTLSKSRLDIFRSAGYQEKIVDRITSKSDGQFLWVKLVLEGLLKATFHWELEEIMNDLPQGLEQAYDRVLKKLITEPPRRREAAIKLLQWLTCTERVMNMKELGAALAIREGETEVNPMGQVVDLRHFVEQVCGSLVELREPSNPKSEKSIGFVHGTVKEYLLSSTASSDSAQASISTFKVRATYAHGYLAGTCITQLCFRFTNETPTGTENLSDLFPFLDYSSKFWATHLVQSGVPNAATLRKVLTFVKSENFRAYLARQGQTKSDLSQMTVLQSQLNTWISKCNSGDQRIRTILNCFRDQYTETVKHDERLFGTEHPTTLNSLYQLAHLNHYSGDWREAKSMYERVLHGRSGPNDDANQHTLDATFQLATVLTRLGEHAESEKLHLQALHGRRKVLGPTHADTLLSEDGLAVTLKERKLLDQAESLSRGTLQRKTWAFGPDDIRTISSANNLAAILKDVGTKHRGEENSIMAVEAWQECEQLSLKCLAVREGTLGPEHPETITVINMLGIVTRLLGRPEESEAFHRRAFQTRLMLFGPESPHTQRSMRNLIATLKDQCKDQEVAVLEARLEKSMRANPVLAERMQVVGW